MGFGLYFVERNAVSLQSQYLTKIINERFGESYYTYRNFIPPEVKMNEFPTVNLFLLINISYDSPTKYYLTPLNCCNRFMALVFFGLRLNDFSKASIESLL